MIKDLGGNGGAASRSSRPVINNFSSTNQNRAGGEQRRRHPFPLLGQCACCIGEYPEGRVVELGCFQLLAAAAATDDKDVAVLKQDGRVQGAPFIHRASHAERHARWLIQLCFG